MRKKLKVSRFSFSRHAMDKPENYQPELPEMLHGQYLA